MLLPLLALVQDGGEAAPTGASFRDFLFPLVLVFAIFYFLVMRPEKRNRQRHAEMLATLQKGDKVITTGGMYATVVGLGEGTVTLQIADGVRAKFAMAAVQTRLEDAPAVSEK